MVLLMLQLSCAEEIPSWALKLGEEQATGEDHGQPSWA